ncbi:MAG: hypothetical protein KMY53_10710 [Desulfarculus sp.]|nr:hypothetical protein [Pseudomonadota bacterium]MBV1715899.1 hypothetical protein [Desulfarculus sp.]MBU4573100.1 hypothetical protein [Pseudomonadota bacterium]MBU4600252.1 hypothetical protein [Pseudomonadota bacterium]MBV1738625.1 hypothetical protein [Desulfarculus sp.]
MNRQTFLDGWAFSLLVTLLAAMVLAGSYLWLRVDLKNEALSEHRRLVDNQLNLWQEQLYDAKWDSVADTSDDVRHLGSYDEARLMADTLVWYVYPDGHSIIEGTAVIGLDGRARPSKQAAVINDAGEPLDPELLAHLKKEKPWLEDPWLGSYQFVIKAFQDDPERESFISPFIQAPGRLVFVIAAPWRDEAGALKGAVIQQQAIGQLFNDVIKPGTHGVSLWLMDAKGTLGVATDQTARESAKIFLASGALPQAMAKGLKAAQEGKFGAGGSLVQGLGLETAHLYWRTMGDSFIVAVVENTAGLGAQGQRTLNRFGAIALISLVLLAAAGGAYTLLYLRRENRMLEKAALRRYTGTVSHRVRNSLSVIRGVNEMFQHKLPGDQGPLSAGLVNAETAIEDIEDTVRELERLSQGQVDLVYDGQVGKASMYRLHPDKKQGGQG